MELLAAKEFLTERDKGTRTTTDARHVRTDTFHLMTRHSAFQTMSALQEQVQPVDMASEVTASHAVMTTALIALESGILAMPAMITITLSMGTAPKTLCSKQHRGWLCGQDMHSICETHVTTF